MQMCQTSVFLLSYLYIEGNLLIMKDWKTTPWKFILVNFVIGTVTAMIIYPAVDFIISLMRKTTFTYTVSEHIVSPLIFGICYGVINYFINGRKKDK